MSQSLRIQQQSWTEPSDRFAEFASRPYVVWLDTAVGANGYSIVAAEPAKMIRSKGTRIEIITPTGVDSLSGNPFDILDEQLAPYRQSATANFPVGAAIGYFGYDLKNFIEKLPSKAVDDIGLPDCWFGFYDNLLIFEHATKRVWEVLGEKVSWPISKPTPSAQTTGDLRSNFTRERYRETVLRAKQYIAAGDIYQVNLSQRFQCGTNAVPAEVYRALRKSNPAPYCAYLDIGEAQIHSSSPECFLNIHDRNVVTRPIKGTRARGKEDAQIAADLLASSKDNAELVMITDLERNDLGRVCEFGSVRVSELVRLETYATVHHLVSTVGGQLRKDVSHVDCVRACFPGGSITGAPKIRAMEIIDELEPHKRGVYTGAIGFLGYNGVSHLNVAIRTLLQRGGELTFHAGGGIVADSDPEAEYAETFAKAQGILNAIDQLRLR